MTLLLALVGAAWAGCIDARPIAGTAGFTNGLEAARINATTYSAAEFAKRRLYGEQYGAIDSHVVLNVAGVPAWCEIGGDRFEGRMVRQPLHLTASNVGLRLPLLEDGPYDSELTVYYASSITWSTLQNPGIVLPTALINNQVALWAPVAGRSGTGRSLSRYTIDWIAGATFRSDIVSVQAGYTGTRGYYVDVTQERIALFFNSAFQGGFGLRQATWLLAGLNQLDPRRVSSNADRRIGMTSVFYRELPAAGATPAEAPPAVEDDGGDDKEPRSRRPADRLRTGHIRQEDVLERFDVRVAWHFGQTPWLREAAVATHSTSWHSRAGRERDESVSWSVRAGVLNLPDQLTLGVRGGLRPTLRADLLHRHPGANQWGIRLSARMNDPDLLDLYPFAYNALGMNLELTYVGEPR